MSGVIFLDQGNGELLEMKMTPYVAEDQLQVLLTDYPNLLASQQHGITGPQRWLLLSREQGIPGEEGGGDRWAVDHLFLDQQGVPTLVEVKRSTDTRIRREVVGQMLDYGANAVVYHSVERLRTEFEARCEQSGSDPADVVAESLGRRDYDAFWVAVAGHLGAGRVRMIFVADELPSELRRIIEFLNEQMSPAEVVGVEIKQYLGQDHRALVPNVVGWTEQALARKVPRGRAKGQGRVQLSVEDALDRVNLYWNQSSAPVVRAIVEAAQARQLTLAWNPLPHEGIFIGFKGVFTRRLLFSLKTSEVITFEMLGFRTDAPFDTDNADRRHELVSRLNSINGIALTSGIVGQRGFQHFPLPELQHPTNMQEFFAIWDWVLEEFRKADLAR